MDCGNDCNDNDNELDFSPIETDPDAFAMDCDVETLEGLIEMACDIYYNNSNPKQKYLSDNAYDALLYHYNKKTRNTDQAKSKIGALPNKRLRTELPFFMPSLNKVKIGQGLESFLQTDKPIVWSLKLDGISVMIVYEDYKPKYAYMRGTGEVGSEISFVLDHIELPELTEISSIVVRGEMIIPKDIWQQKFSKAGKNDTTARNYVSGLLNAGHVNKNLQYLHFVAYDIVYLNMEVVPSPADALGILEALNFKVVKNGVFETRPLASEILNLYQTYSERSLPNLDHDNDDDDSKHSTSNTHQNDSINHNLLAGVSTSSAISTDRYMIDGIVLSIEEERTLPKQLENPTNTVAFKINLVEQIRETEVTKVDWNISRHGRLIPVAEFKTVYIDGCRVHRATVTNASKCIKKFKLCIGTKLKVTRSGQVIPKIISTVEQGGEPPVSTVRDDIGIEMSKKKQLAVPGVATEFKDGVPIKGYVVVEGVKYNWLWKGLDLILEDPDSCPEVHLKRHIHFFTTLNIKGIKEGMLRKMNAGGLTKLNEILNADKKRLLQIKGIGPKLSEKFYNEIRNGIAKTKMYRLMIASNCFPQGMGKTFIRQIVEAIPNVLNEHQYPLNVKNNTNLYSSLVKLPGIGKTRATNFIEGLKKFKEFIKDYPNVEENNRKFLEQIAKNGYNFNVKNRSFVFTNLEDDELEDYLLDHHAVINKVVDRSTTAVVTGNICAMSTKQLEAAKLGIRVYTVSEFKQLFNIPI